MTIGGEERRDVAEGEEVRVGENDLLLLLVASRGLASSSSPLLLLSQLGLGV